MVPLALGPSLFRSQHFDELRQHGVDPRRDGASAEESRHGEVGARHRLAAGEAARRPEVAAAKGGDASRYRLDQRSPPSPTRLPGEAFSNAKSPFRFP